MTFSKHIVLAFASLFTLAVSAQTSAGKLVLSKGQKLQIDNTINTLSKQEMMGQSIEITIEASMVHQVEVKDKKKGSYVLSSTLTKVVTNGSAMGQQMKFDSDKKEDMDSSDAGKALKGQINVPKEVEMSEAGTILNGVKKDTSATNAQMMDMISNMTAGSGDQSNGASAAFLVIPAGKKAGDSWSDSSVTDDIKTYRNYTIKTITGKDAAVSLTGKQLTKKTISQQGMDINVSMEGTLTGESTVDIGTGLVKQQTLVMDGTSSTEVMGQSIPGTTKVTTTTTVKSM